MATSYRYKSYLILFSIAVIVVVSGCTSSGGGSSSRILSIEAFEPDIRGVDILPGEIVKFTLIVRNTGTEKAKDVTATISGLDGWTDTGTVGSACKSGTVIAQELSAPRPAENFPGQSKQCIFVYRAPENLPLSQTFQPKVSIRYTYDTATVARITLPTRDKFVTKQDSGQTFDSETIFKSNSPIDIDLNTKGQAAQIRVLQNKDVKFPLFITVNNIDGGYVCQTPPSCSDTLKKIKLELTSGTPGKLRIENCAATQIVDLFKGQKGELKCDLVAPGATDLISEEVVSITTKSTDYAYTIESTGAQISVKRE